VAKGRTHAMRVHRQGVPRHSTRVSVAPTRQSRASRVNGAPLVELARIAWPPRNHHGVELRARRDRRTPPRHGQHRIGEPHVALLRSARESGRSIMRRCRRALGLQPSHCVLHRPDEVGEIRLIDVW
jgi:hypothetical protein